MKTKTYGNYFFLVACASLFLDNDYSLAASDLCIFKGVIYSTTPFLNIKKKKKWEKKG